MKPTRSPEDEHAVVELLDAVLANGVIVQADVVVSVGSVPLIGIRLEAAVAGLSEMVEYGYFEDWEMETTTPPSSGSTGPIGAERGQKASDPESR